MVRPIDTKAIKGAAELKGFEPVKAREHGKPKVSFKSDAKPSAPKMGLVGNPLFAARGGRGGIYKDLSPAQRASVVSSLEQCRQPIIETYGEEAFEAAAGIFMEAMEFTNKTPA